MQSLVQYSNQIDRLSANLRFGWLNTAGTGLFIVYNDIQGVDALDGPLGRSLIAKFTRQINVLGGRRGRPGSLQASRTALFTRFSMSGTLKWL